MTITGKLKAIAYEIRNKFELTEDQAITNRHLEEFTANEDESCSKCGETPCICDFII